MTTKLYLHDSYLAEAEARIVQRELVDGRWRLILDQTIFCPRGGGQPEDRGTINGIPVQELSEDKGEIVHVLATDPVGDQVGLQIDFGRRFDHMQQHTAQHLLSQVLVREMNVATLSFAIGADHASVEVSAEEMGEEQMRRIEADCLELIGRGLAVDVFSTTDAASVPLRKPPKKEGELRIVAIGDYDHTACGGTHLKNTAEIGLIKIMRAEKVRGHLRLYYLAGRRALVDYQKKSGLLYEIQHRITLPEEEIPAAVGRLVGERDALSREVRAYRRQALDAEIAELGKSAAPLIVRRFESEALEEMKYFTAALLKKGRNLFSYSPALGYIQIGRGSGSADLKKIAAEVFSLLAGKGGGRETLVEGKATDFTKIDQAIAFLKNELAGR